jgi:hypothetical protein
MKKILDFLKGKKTYLIAIIGGVTFAIARLGTISTDIEVQIYTLLGIGSIATLRDAIK